MATIDNPNQLNPQEGFIHKIADGVTGTTSLAIALTNAAPDGPLGGIKASGTQLLIVETGSNIGTQLVAVALAGPDSHVINNATIRSETATSIAMSGTAGRVENRGLIESVLGTAILFSGGGTGTVDNGSGKTIKGKKAVEIASTSGTAKLDLSNAGTIEAIAGTDPAVIGGLGADRIINTGTIKAATASGVALDLKDGDDLYDGRSTGPQTGVVGTIKLGAGDDIAYGGSGAETFSGGIGSNVIDGGAGYDTIDYSQAPAGTDGKGITVNLGTSTLQWTNYSSDTLLDIENVIGSDHNDSLTGSVDKNTLMGGAGDDTLDGSFGDDSLDGGTGTNTAKFSSSTAAEVNLTITGAQATGYGQDTLINIQNLEGGSGADKFTGDGANNRLTGNGGNDTLVGAAGNDTLVGGSGADNLQGGADADLLQGETGDDSLEGGAGNDTLEGGTGKNTAVFSGNWADYDIAPNAAGGFTVTDRLGRDGTDTLKDVRFATFADKTVALTNGAASNISPSISPINFSESKAVGSQVTTLFSSDPDGDTLTFSLVTNAGGLFRLDGSKLILAGALDYEAATKHTITVKVSDGFGGDFSKELTINVTNDMTETKPLVKRGTNASEQVVGENGNDQLHGLSGNDQVFGQGGNDKLWGDKGNDTLIGGAGNDVFVFDVRPNVKSNLDYVYDFNVKDDTIHLSKKIFSGLAKKGTLSKNAFVIGDHFKDADDRILYHKKGGALFYDPDGTGDAKAIQFATIGKNLKITHKDFYVI